MTSHAVFSVLALLAMALCISAQSVPAGAQVAQDPASKSSLVVSPSPTTGTVSVAVTLGPCTGLQIHTHNETELLLASPGNAGPIKVAYVDGASAVQEALVQPGALFALPTGLVHYQYNPSCTPASFTSTLKIDANTQLVLSALSSISAADYSTYAATPAAQAYPGFFSINKACMRTCSGSAGRKLM